MSDSMPRCSRCGERHYNFTPCVEAAAHRGDMKDRVRREANARQPELRPRETDWRDRAPTLIRISHPHPGHPEVIGVRRGPLHSITHPRKEAA